MGRKKEKIKWFCLSSKKKDYTIDQLYSLLEQQTICGVEEKKESYNFFLEVNEQSVMLLENLNKNIEVSFIAAEDWQKKFCQSLKMTMLTQEIAIVPKHLKPSAKVKKNIILDPGMAFGSGLHGSTKSVALLLEKYLSSLSEKEKDNVNFLDLGCGSGILSLVAVNCGLKSCLAIDNDPQAIAVAKENIKKNSKSKFIAVKDTALADLKKSFRLIAANILSGTLIELSSTIAAKLAAGGYLISGGVMVEEQEEFYQKFSELFTKKDELIVDNWLATLWQKC